MIDTKTFNTEEYEDCILDLAVNNDGAVILEVRGDGQKFFVMSVQDCQNLINTYKLQLKKAYEKAEEECESAKTNYRFALEQFGG